jgi:hypothetical protein
MENPIEKLAGRLQLLPASVRWLYAQDNVVQAAALRFVPQRGRWSRVADSMVAFCLPIGLAKVISAIVNLVLLGWIYARQSLVQSAPVKGALFVGIGALREPELVYHFKEMQRMAVIQLDERGLTDFFRQAHVPFFALVREMRSVWSEVWKFFDASESLKGLENIYLISFLLMRGHRFAYLRAWLRHYLSQPGASPTAAWTCASYLSYAPVAIGMETIHMEHGFQRHSLVYPDFAQSICFNSFDAAQLTRRLPSCDVRVVVERARQLTTRRAVAVAAILGDPDSSDLIRPFLQWAVRNDVPAIIRKHPMDTSDYWNRWRGVVGIEITDGEGSFIEFLDRFRPRLLASWYSTALYDAIVKGVVPITVIPESHEAALDTVFPFRDLSLRWPEHEQLALCLLDDDNLRAEFLADRYAQATGASRSAVSNEMGVAR